MAAITPSGNTPTRTNNDVTLHIITFAAVGDGDTYASAIEGIIGFNYLVTADPTTNTSAGCNVSESGGTFTFFPGIVALSGTLFVYARS